MEQTNSRQLVREVFALREFFYTEWRTAEAQLHGERKDLIAAAEGSDFVRAANLSMRLVALKARVQACQAAQHEIRCVIEQSKVTQPAIELAPEHAVKADGAAEAPRLAKVIPLMQGKR